MAATMSTPTSPAAPLLPTQGWSLVSRGAAGPRPTAPPEQAGQPARVPDDIVARLAASAAAERFPGREVAVDSYYDTTVDRPVFRVADRRTGEVLLESPPEELLRFFAAAREPPGAPLVVLEA